jgi:hypothetical protein
MSDLRDGSAIANTSLSLPTEKGDGENYYAHRMKVLQDAGFGPIARALLDRMTKAGCWCENPPSPAKA